MQIIEAGTILRIQANSPFLLHWTNDDWQHATDTPSKTTAAGIDYADIVVPNSTISVQFTFFWVDEDRWEGEDYNVQVRATAQMRRRVAVRVKSRLPCWAFTAESGGLVVQRDIRTRVECKETEYGYAAACPFRSGRRVK